MYRATTATRKVFRMTKRIRGVCGGTSASKTISILLTLIDKAQRDKSPTITSVVSESFPHLKRGAMRDFLNIMETHGYYVEDRWNKTDFVYTFETGSRLEFFSADQADKVRGPRRDRLFINEANNVPLDAFDQLEVRTKEFIYLDWNPASEFWFYTDVLGKRDDVELITLTYRDNEALDPRIVASIEQRKGNARWWKVYGEGQLGDSSDRVYSGWRTIDAVPFEAKLKRRGLDFGYTNDPSAIVDVYEYDGGYILDQLLYQPGMTNRQLGDFILQLPQCLVIADSSEPKSIDELALMKIPIIGATKGPGSVQQGIQYVQDQRISVTARSVDLLSEYRKYVWRSDRDGRLVSPNVPVDGYDHCMDALRYALTDMQAIRKAQRPAPKPFRSYYGRNFKPLNESEHV